MTNIYNPYVAVTSDVVSEVEDHVDMQIQHPSVTNEVVSSSQRF